MTPTDEFADELTETHRAFYRQKPRGELVQTCVIVGDDGKTTAIKCGWDGDAERGLTLALLRSMMRTLGAVRYVIWGEVWLLFAKRDPGETIEEGRRKALAETPDFSKAPNRVECVFTLVVEASGRRAHRLQRIVRGRSGGVRTLVDMEPMDDLGGALAELLPERTFN